MPDNLVPRRRWFQFRLSTWMVLVAILACMMLEWPWFQFVERTYSVSQQEWRTVHGGDEHLGTFLGAGFEKNLLDDDQTYRTDWYKRYLQRRLNPALLFPTLALAAFVGWKAAWLVFERRRKETT